MTLCEEDCILIDYNYTNKKAKCSCLTKISFPAIGEIKFDKNKLYKSFTNIKSIANLNIMKCFNKAFEGNSISKNSSFYIYLIYLIFFSAILFLFYYKYFSMFIKVIQDILNAKKYLSTLKASNNYMVTSNIPQQMNIEKGKRGKKYSFNKNDKLGIKQDKNNNEIIPPKKKKKKKKKRNTVNTMMMSSKIDAFNSQEIIEPRNNNDYIINPPTIKNIDDYIIIRDIQDKYKEILEYNDYEMNKLSYEEAIIKDQRTYIQYYLSLLRSGHILIFAFYFKNNDYNSKIIKIFLFFFLMIVHFTVNALFFNDKTMHKIYIDNGSYDFIYQIPQIIYSSIISMVISVLVKYLSLSQKIIVKFKQEKNNGLFDLKFQKVLLILKIRFILFFIVTFLLLLTFAYYNICFCGIYVNTQVHLLKDSIISFTLSLVYPFGIYLIPGIFRRKALNDDKKSKKYLYKFSQILQSI